MDHFPGILNLKYSKWIHISEKNSIHCITVASLPKAFKSNLGYKCMSVSFSVIFPCMGEGQTLHKEYYEMFIRYIVSQLILIRNIPEGLILCEKLRCSKLKNFINSTPLAQAVVQGVLIEADS